MLHRRLTDRERSMLNKLQSLPNSAQFIANIIDDAIEGARIRVSRDANAAWIRLELERFSTKAQQKAAYDRIIQILRDSFGVVDELFDLGVIRRLDLETDEPFQFGPGIVNAPSVDMPVDDPAIVNQLIEWAPTLVAVDEDRLGTEPEH